MQGIRGHQLVELNGGKRADSPDARSRLPQCLQIAQIALELTARKNFGSAANSLTAGAIHGDRKQRESCEDKAGCYKPSARKSDAGRLHAIRTHRGR